MKFEQFERIMNACLTLSEEANGLGDAIKDYFDGHVICTIGHSTTAIIYKALEETLMGGKPLSRMEDGREWEDISWWVHETECGKKNTTITHQDGKEQHIKTLRDLYDLILQKVAE